MPTLSSSYRDGTSESAKRHARGAAAHLAWLAEKEAAMTRVTGRAWVTAYQIFQYLDVRPTDDADLFPAGFEAFFGPDGQVPLGSAVPAIDWLTEHGVAVEMSDETRQLLGL